MVFKGVSSFCRNDIIRQTIPYWNNAVSEVVVRAGSVLKPKPKLRFSVKTEPKPKLRFRWESKSVLRPH